ELELVAGDACRRSRGCADLCRVIREGSQIVSVESGLAGELGPGQLHAVAGISGEADDSVIDVARRTRGGGTTHLASEAVSQRSLTERRGRHKDGARVQGSIEDRGNRPFSTTTSTRREGRASRRR